MSNYLCAPIYYLRRIHLLDETGPGVNSIMELNPDAPAIARHMDAERRRGIIRSPLHGIPILLKDNIDTGDKMQTAAGSLALVGTPALQDSTVAAKLLIDTGHPGGGFVTQDGIERGADGRRRPGLLHRP